MLQLYKTEGSLLYTEENSAYTSSIEGLMRAMEEGKILEGVAIRCSNVHGLTVELGGYVGIMERDEVAYDMNNEPIKDIAIITRVGKPICFKVKKIVRDKNSEPKVYLSRKDAQLECVVNYLSGLVPGDIIPAKVTHLEHFGAFADIGCGVVSLLSIDSISVSRISHPKDRLSVGLEIPVVIRSVEKDSGKLKRIFVSRKELLGSWEENASLFEVGQTVTGIVRSIESYGVFIELTPNLAGLAECRDDISVGQAVAVYIKSMIPERMKIKLVIVDSYHGIRPRLSTETFNCTEKSHINSWRYSPDGCDRVIESIFD